MKELVEVDLMKMEKKAIKVGIIGCGSRGLNNIGFNIVDGVHQNGFIIVAVANRSIESTGFAAEKLEQRYKSIGMDQSVKRCKSYVEIIEDESIDFVIITSHTDAHLEHAIPAIEAGKKVFLEKPISVSLEDARRIADAEANAGKSIMMGFTRRYEDSWIKMKELLDKGTVGDLQMILLRSVIPYSRYLQGWHRKREWSGGPLNDKCSHHFDVIRWMSGLEFDTVSSYGGRSSVFRVDPTAPKRCSECDRECVYRSTERLEEAKELTGEKYVASADKIDERSIPDACVYSPDSDVEDFGSINFQMENGVVGNLFFSIFGPIAPDSETLEFVGDSGRLVLTRSTGKVVAYSDYGKEREEFFAGGPNFDSSHYGSDKNLIHHMRDFCDGAEPICNAMDGLASLEMVNAARDSFDLGGQLSRVEKYKCLSHE